VIPQETEDLLLQHATALKDLLPWLIELQSEERMRLAKLSRRRQEFLDKIHIHAVQNPEFMPQYADITEYINDMDSSKSLQKLNAKLLGIQKMIQDSIMLLQSDAYNIGRAFYKSVQTAYKHGAPGAEKIIEDLSYHFKRKSNSSTNNTTEEPQIQNKVPVETVEPEKTNPEEEKE
jgi:hypothetical protein